VSVRLRAIVAAALVLAAIGGWRWWNAPERQVERLLDGIAEGLSHDRPVTGVATIAAAARLQQYFSPAVVVEVGQPFSQLSGRDAVVSAAARLIAATPALRVEFVDVEIELAAGGDTATVRCGVTATLDDRAGQQTVDARELTLALREAGGRWVVERVASVNILEPVT
jgi:ketosteroid isomerase-like protein